MVFIRISFVLLLLTCLGLVGQAQLKFGPSIGASILNINVNDDLFPNANSTPTILSNEIGADFGAVIRYDVNEKYSLKMLSFYSERRYTEIATNYIDHFTVFFNQFNTSLNFSYQPIKSFRTEIGIDHISINSITRVSSPPREITYDVNRNDIGVLAGASYSIIGLEFTMNYRIGLWTTNTEDRPILDIYKPFNYFRLSVAYLFDLNFKKGNKKKSSDL